MPARRDPDESADPVELSESRLQEIIALVYAQPAEPVGGVRLAPRVRAGGRVTLLPFAHGRTGERRAVDVYDLSRTGVAVLDRVPTDPGDQFLLQIARDGAAPRRPIEVLCTARHCRPIGGRHLVGAEFGASWLATLGAMMAPR